MAEDGLAGALQVLAEAKRLASAPENLPQPPPTLLKRQRPEILTIEPQQVEGEQAGSRPTPPLSAGRGNQAARSCSGP